MNGRNIFLCAGCAFAFFASGAQAQLYQCKGEDGRVRFVSSAEQCSSSYKELPSFSGKKPVKKSSAAAPKASSSSSSPGKFGKVSSRRQSEMDKKRGDILLYELRSEKQIELRLNGMAESAEDDKRRTFLQKRRDEHRRNIASIRRELARLGYRGAE